MHFLKLASLLVIAISPIIAVPVGHESRTVAQVAEDVATLTYREALQSVKAEGRLIGNNQEALALVWKEAQNGRKSAQEALTKVTNKAYPENGGSAEAGPAGGIAEDIFKAVRTGNFGSGSSASTAAGNGISKSKMLSAMGSALKGAFNPDRYKLLYDRLKNY